MQTSNPVRRLSMISVVLLLLGACAPEENNAAEVTASSSSESESELQGEDSRDRIGHNRPGADTLIELERKAIAYDYAERYNLPHGVAGDHRFVFITEPLNGNVIVLNRFTGEQVATVPPPEGGFLLPFSLRVPRPGKLVVLDPGGFPAPGVLTVPRVYDYTYSTTGAFEASISRTVRFDGIPIIFPEDVEILDDGRYVVSDSGFGAFWVISAQGTIVPGITPRTLDFPDFIPQLTGCPFNPNLTVGGIPFAAPGGFAPGVGAMAHDARNLYFSGSCQGGLHKVPLAVFSDERAPHERAADIATVTPRAPNDPVESLKGLTFNPYNPADKKLYAADPFHLRLIRIDVRTGEREIVADHPRLFNFPISAAFLPPVAGLHPLVVVSDQEHRFGALNVAIPETIFQIPFIVTKVYTRP